VRLQPAPIFIVSAGQTEQKVIPLDASGTQGVPTTVLTQTIGAEILPVKFTKLTSSIVESFNNDVKVSTTNFGAQIWTGQHVEITTGMINRASEAPGNSPLDTRSAQIALRPMKLLTVTGGCTWNPETNGVVQQALRQELGLNANLGSIQVGSTYMLTTLNGLSTADAMDPQYGQVSLSLGFKFSRYTNLSGTYKDELRYHSAMDYASTLLPQYLRSYGLGLTHNLGSSLNLTLGGSLTDDRSKINQPTDVKGEAKLGLRF
jgi:hypothetical protein